MAPRAEDDRLHQVLAALDRLGPGGHGNGRDLDLVRRAYPRAAQEIQDHNRDDDYADKTADCKRSPFQNPHHVSPVRREVGAQLSPDGCMASSACFPTVRACVGHGK